ncbi:hypothetical protein EJ04DRAFT_509854 [Polyplosphaeria fusca]|uniref:Uncharacterized protein n=1 Tax=Polyplosphaeria fusca TaxID=682080 RepID=A0A9P4R6Y8_9PLEO|nr:hypothetical protein EJ04DRAFT_509854 [Polyplosphaeria fusca]
MPPKTVKSRQQAREPSYASNTLAMFTDKENRGVVTAIGLFAVGVAFLHSSWSEILLPA